MLYPAFFPTIPLAAKAAEAGAAQNKCHAQPDRPSDQQKNGGPRWKDTILSSIQMN
jgi:hypothetical protein